MRRIARIKFGAFLCLCVLVLIANEVNLQPIPGKVILRLRYRGETSELKKNPYTIGIFEREVEDPAEYIGALMGTDWDGCIYIFDPIKPDLWVLKRFDRQGKFQEEWNPIRARYGENVAVTKDGYVWLGIRWVDSDRLRGFPLVAYQKGKKAPIIDWRRELPKHVKDVRDKVSAEIGVDWEKIWEERKESYVHPWDVSVYHLDCGPNRIGISLHATFFGAENYLARFLWILCSSDGKEIFEAHIGTRVPFLGFDGNIWIKEIERLKDIWSSWKRIWLFKRGEEKEEPLIDLEKKQPEWINKVIFGEAEKVYGPTINIDAKGNIYVIFERGFSLERQRIKIQVEGKYRYVLAPTIGGAEGALVVLDKHRRFLTHLPWTLTYLEYPNWQHWIKPLPDGSGFYRIEFREREAVIYFHPLSPQKP